MIEQPFIWLDPTQQVAAAARRRRRGRDLALDGADHDHPLRRAAGRSRRSTSRRPRCSAPDSSQRLRHVTLPMLKPSIQVALLLRLIFAFEVFAVVIAMTGDGSTVLAAEAYEWQSDQPERERRSRVRVAHPRPVARRGRPSCWSRCARRRSRGCVDASDAASASAGRSPTSRRCSCSAFILFPIYLITLAAFSTHDAVYEYPKKLLPTDALDGDDELLPRLRRHRRRRCSGASSSRRSRIVASRSRSARRPATRSARFAFRGADPFQLAIVEHARVPDHHPRDPARGHLPPRWDSTTPSTASRSRTRRFTLPLTVLVTASVFAGISSSSRRRR